jgi:hypothetical protein
MSYQECLLDYRQWRKKHGTSSCDAVIRSENRQRINLGRDKRDKTSKAEKQKMFNDQKGICPICDDLLFIPAYDRRNEVDHIDPNRTDLNHWTNKQLVHGNPCNRKKSGKSIAQQSKETGKTYEQIIDPGYKKP